MVPAQQRMRGRRVFARVMRGTRPIHSREFTVRAIVNDGGVSRFSFVVSTRVHKRAVHRNKLRRRMREIIRHELPHIRPGLDILIAAKQSALALDYWQMCENLLALFSKARLIADVATPSNKSVPPRISNHKRA